jgi:hypothetical protein
VGEDVLMDTGSDVVRNLNSEASSQACTLLCSPNLRSGRAGPITTVLLSCFLNKQRRIGNVNFAISDGPVAAWLDVDGF